MTVTITENAYTIDATADQILVENVGVLHEGDILRMDNEIVVVTTESTTNVIDIERAWNGSTAAAHAADTVIKRWYTEPAIVKATGIQAHRLFKRRDAPFGVIGNAASGSDMRISNLDMDVAALVRPFVRLF